LSEQTNFGLLHPYSSPVDVEGRMKLHSAVIILAEMLALSGNAPADAQKVDLRAEEAAIRTLVNRPDHPPRTDDAIFWSGAYPRPIIGGLDTASVKPLPGARMEQRQNIKTTTDIVRLEVAAAGDMAYEFSHFTLSYDLADTKEHVSFAGSALRVWKKVNGQWRVAAAFMRPHEAK
jgi:ketosteroid isomerase-like protein